MEARAWHAHPIADVAEWLGADTTKGLSIDEVHRRQKLFGPNHFEKGVRLSFIRKVWRYLKSPFVLILGLAFVATLFLGSYTDAIVIALAIVINIAIGVFQEGRTDRAFERLTSSQERFSLVVRDGRIVRIPSRQIVPGDIVVIRAGEVIPADTRLFDARDVFCNEAPLTGEPMPVEKTTEVVFYNAPLTEQKNMVWMGTSMVSGNARGLVTTIGTATAMGNIAEQLLTTRDDQTPIQKNIAKLARFISIVVAGVTAVVFVLGILRGESISAMLLLAVAVAVSAIPEGLPAAVAVSLAVGMERLLEKGGLVRTMITAETLGSTTFILTDKTGTLTRAEMTFRNVYTADEGALSLGSTAQHVLRLGMLASDVVFESSTETDVHVNGRPMEKIMTESALALGVPRAVFDTHVTVGAVPFNSKERFAAYVRVDTETKKRRMYVAGAPEILLHASTWQGTDGKQKLSKEERDETHAFFERESEKGYRVIAVAWKDVPHTFDVQHLTRETVLNTLVFGGLISFEDPLRFDARGSVLRVQSAGARVCMITGDNQKTAATIAAAVGINGAHAVLTGVEIEPMSDSELLQALQTHSVFARVLPLQKMRMAKVLKDAGEVVAMTGDGINDAPALKAADIGVALGSGTEVAKEASDLVLIHDSFSIIVSAIEEGRRIMDNLKKMVTHLLSTSFGEIMIIIGAIIAGMQLPILPVQILWLNIIEEGVLSFAFAFEPVESDVLRRNPKSEGVKTLLSSNVKKMILISGVVSGALAFGIFIALSSFDFSIEYIRTLMFGVLSLGAIVFALSLKSLSEPVWRIKLFNNPYLFWAVVTNTLLFVLTLTVPVLQNLLSVVSPGAFGWGLFVVSAALNLAIIEIVKLLVFKRRREGAIRPAQAFV
ncbi:MAG: HAD-IC family P-type ATPase [Candidatus Campbellbacteria bacterium]|nr:HAD-IC family P-type ATPase [Candidatus Campbellbacteria bacterium]